MGAMANYRVRGSCLFEIVAYRLEVFHLRKPPRVVDQELSSAQADTDPSAQCSEALPAGASDYTQAPGASTSFFDENRLRALSIGDSGLRALIVIKGAGRSRHYTWRVGLQARAGALPDVGSA